LYRTKLCKSHYRNGVCREYGVYCAKAHKPSDARDLVKIYGENWKRHYDLSGRDENVLSSNSKSESTSEGSNEVVAVSMRMRNNRMITNQCFHKNSLSKHSTSYHFKKKVNDIYDDSQSISDNMDSPSLISCLPHLTECMTDLSLIGEVNSYVELYNDEHKAPRQDTSIAPLNTTWYNQVKSNHKFKTTSMSICKESLQDVQDDWKNYEPNPLDINWKMESKHSWSDKENVDHCEEYISDSQFALSSYNIDIGCLFLTKPQN